ncbi:DNA repair protein XRCC3 [Trichoplax sp. H2]|nr:DNA repair protein XRCC3 [Trichoplax sp. H2]|eukprot:RDD42514.1 DNA repair protein XRCC3 [Trichoplax sp. H2]
MEDITRWELPPRIIRAATEANLRNCDKILTLSVGDIQRKTNLSQSDSKLLTKTASKKVLGSGKQYHSALQLLRRENCSPTAMTKVTSCGCPTLDRFLRGGILIPGLTEIAGESASGKTQFCLQLSLAVQLPYKLGGLQSGAVYICTEGSFPARRLHQMIPFFENRLKEHQLESIKFSDNVYVEHAMTIEELQDIMENTLPRLLSRGEVRLVIIDSIAALFRSEFDIKEAAQRATQLHKFGRQLLRYGSIYDTGFICVNQVSDTIDPRTFDVQQGEKNIVRSVIPALGLAWSNVVNIRLILSRCEYLYNSIIKNDDSEFSELTPESVRFISHFPVIRKMKVLLAPHLRMSESYFLVDGLGIKGIENVTTYIESQMRKLKPSNDDINQGEQMHL